MTECFVISERISEITGCITEWEAEVRVVLCLAVLMPGRQLVLSAGGVQERLSAAVVHVNTSVFTVEGLFGALQWKCKASCYAVPPWDLVCRCSHWCAQFPGPEGDSEACIPQHVVAQVFSVKTTNWLRVTIVRTLAHE